MARRYSGESFRPSAKLLHWSIATLVLFNIVVGITHEKMAKPVMALVMGWHKAIGILVLALMVIWILQRLSIGRPQPAIIPAWQRRLSRIVHGLLFAILLIMPISGWWMTSASPKRAPISFFGWFDVPFLPVTQGPAGLGGTFHQLHMVFGLSLLALVVLHIGAALWHHYASRDAVLVNMLPFAGRGKS